MTDNTNASRESSSRRHFLKTSSAAAVGGAIASQLMVPGSVHAQGIETIRVGLIGCGGRGTGAAQQAIMTKGPVKLVAMGDTFKHKLDASLQALQNNRDIKMANRLDRIDVPAARQFTGLDAFQKVIDSDVDLVILTTPPGFRPLHFAEAITKGKHVFMEKPVAVDAPGVHRVLQTARQAKENKLAVGVGLQRHHELKYLETMKRLKEDKMIGEIHTMRAYWNGAGVWGNRKTARQLIKDPTEMQVQVHDWYWYNWLSGDHICEQHIHNLDVCNWLKGEPDAKNLHTAAYPVEAQGMGGREVRTGKPFGDIYDHHAVEFIYADGARLFSFCRHIPGTWSSVSEHAQGTKGSADISGGQITVGKETWRYRSPEKRDDAYQNEHDALFASIRSGEPINEAENGAMSTMTAILGRMCTYSGKRITMEQALASKKGLGPANKDTTWQTTPPVVQVAVPGLSEVL